MTLWADKMFLDQQALGFEFALMMHDLVTHDLPVFIHSESERAQWLRWGIRSERVILLPIELWGLHKELLDGVDDERAIWILKVLDPKPTLGPPKPE